MEKKVLYLGNSETYNIFIDVAHKTETVIVPEYALTKTQEELLNKALSEPYVMIILNVAEIFKAAPNLTELIRAIVSGTKTKLVVMAQGYSPNSSLVVESAKAGVKYFMLSNDTSGLLETYINTLAGVKNVDKIIDVYSIETKSMLEKSDVNSSKLNYTDIGVGGCINRIGVTSVAIQLIKFFQSVGKKACYIDVTNSNYVLLCKGYYCCDAVDEELNMITIDGIDMFTDVTAETMKSIYLRNYDFIVYDIGNISDNAEKQISFLQKKYRLLVTGQKPNEIHEFNKLIDNMYSRNIVYLFNFVPQADREDVIEDIHNRGVAYFVPFFDDCFSLISESSTMFYDIFFDIIPKPEPQELVQLSKKELKKQMREYRKQKRKNKKHSTDNQDEVIADEN